MLPPSSSVVDPSSILESVASNAEWKSSSGEAGLVGNSGSCNGASVPGAFPWHTGWRKTRPPGGSYPAHAALDSFYAPHASGRQDLSASGKPQRLPFPPLLLGADNRKS